MIVEQLSVFLENESGRLAKMCRVLGDAGIDMHALVVADKADYGVARVLCDRPRSARRILADAGFAVSITRVVAVASPDRPGGLADALERLEAEGVNVEYLYCYVRQNEGSAVDIVRVEDSDTAESVLRGSGFPLIHASQIYTPDAL